MKKRNVIEHYDKHRPSDAFCEWWNPTGVDEPSGASVGGHPDAARMWARKDPGRWVRRAYGITARQAWSTERFRDQFDAWIEAGKPKRRFVSIALNLVPDQKAAMDELKATVAAIEVKTRTRSEDIAARRKLLQEQKVQLAKPVTGKVVEDKDESPF